MSGLHLSIPSADLQANRRNVARREFYEAPDDALFDQHVIAVILGVAPTTLEVWRIAKKGPHFVRVGKKPLYLKRQVIAFLKEREEQEKRERKKAS